MKEKDKEQKMTAEVAALLNTSKTNKVSNNKNISVARQVMAIIARKKKDEWLGCRNELIHPNSQVFRLAPLISSVRNNIMHESSTCTELDSYSNMVVVERNCTIFDDTGKMCTVNTFSETAGWLDDVPIVDEVVAYDCPYQCKTYILLMRNALYIPELDVNLLPPFIARKAGIKLDECPKIQTINHTVNNHSIYISTYNLLISCRLMNIFSYFETRKQSVDKLHTCDKIFITPDASNWNPHNHHN